MMDQNNSISVHQKILLGLFLLTTVFLASCAKLPMENDAPAAPILFSDGVMNGGGVEIIVTVDDPDDDMVALHFTATNSGGFHQDFSWSSFINSGEEASFFLGLGPGQWSLTARAKDELEEQSPTTNYDLIVTGP